MRTIKSILSISILAALAASACASGNDEKEIRATFAKFRKAMMHKDLATIEGLEAPGFMESEHGQSMNAEQSNAMMKQQFGMTKSISKFDVQIKTIKVTGKTAHVTTTYSMVGKIAGMSKGDTKVHSMTATGNMEEDLVKTSKGWQVKTVKETNGSATMDGKPFNPGG